MKLMEWFRRRRGDANAGPRRLSPDCLHVTLVPRWDRAEDIGNEERAASYRCEACSMQFTVEEAARLRRTEAERVERSIVP